MNVKQHYACSPEYIYNTAFGSLLTGLDCIDQTADIGCDEPKADNEQCSQNLFRKTRWLTDGHCRTSTQLYNNSAWNNDHNLQSQSIQDIIKILIDFLGEFLLFISSIIDCEQVYSQFQLQKIVDVAERIHQLRLTLLIQINNPNEPMTNSPVLDIPSISLILHELASFIRCLSKEQQQIEHPHTNMFTQLLDRLEKTIKTCMDCVSMNCNQQSFQAPIPVTFPCLNSPQMINDSTLAIGCWYPCNGSNMCIPWSFFEQIKNSSGKDHIFGLMYGIKDENIRRKLGYGIGKHKSSRRTKQMHKGNDLLNEESNFDRNQEWTTSSTDSQMSVMQKTSVVSTKEKFKTIEPKESKEKNKRISTNSIISQENTPNRFGSSRILSRRQSAINSERSSPLFHDRLTVSDSAGRMTTRVTSSRTGELPITSMLDHSESQRTPSRLIQQQHQSNIYKEDDDKSARSLSFQSYGYQTPSKTTIKVSRESSQSLPPSQSKSIRSQQSNDSIQSRKVPSINSVTQKKSASSIARSDGKQSFKGSINQNPLSYPTHNDNIDSTITFTSPDKIKQNESILNKSWEQRLASPLSITSAQRTSSTHLKQNIISPISSKQLSLNETTTDFNFDNDSEHQISPSTSFLNETNDNISPLNVIERLQSAEGEKNTINSSDINNKKDIPTPHFSPINTYQQRITSATSDSDNSPLFPTTKKHSSRSMRNRKTKFYNQETTSTPLQSNKQGYFNKFMNCFRKTNVNRVNRSNYRNKLN